MTHVSSPTMSQCICVNYAVDRWACVIEVLLTVMYHGTAYIKLLALWNSCQYMPAVFLDNAIRQLIVHDNSVGGNERPVCLSVSVVVLCMRCNCPSQKRRRLAANYSMASRILYLSYAFTCRKYNRSSDRTRWQFYRHSTCAFFSSIIPFMIIKPKIFHQHWIVEV